MSNETNGRTNGKLNGKPGNASPQDRWYGIERPVRTGRRGAAPRLLPDRAHAWHGSARSASGSFSDEEPYVAALGALTGAQAVQMVKAGLKAIYLSGWQVAADGNLAGETYPDQSLYPANSAPALVQRINNALLRADQIDSAEGRKRHPLARADRRRCGGRLRRAAQRLRADEVVHRGGRRRGALRGPALVGEEVRPPRRQGARADEPVHPNAHLRAPRRGRSRRPHGARRPDGRAVRDVAHERRRRTRRRVPHRGADAGGLLPDRARHRGSDRQGPRIRAVRRPALVRDVDARSGRGRTVRRGRARRVPGEAPRLQLLAVLQLEEAPRRPHDRVLPARARGDGLPLPVRDSGRLPCRLRLDVRAREGATARRA